LKAAPRPFTPKELLDLKLVDRKGWTLEQWESLTEHERETWRAYELYGLNIRRQVEDANLITPESGKVNSNAIPIYIQLMLERFFINA
jgi:hypothetical protein